MADAGDEAVIANAVNALMDRRGCSCDAAREYLTFMADGLKVTAADFASLFLFAVDYTARASTTDVDAAQPHEK